MTIQTPKKRGCLGNIFRWSIFILGGILVIVVIAAILRPAGTSSTRSSSGTPVSTESPTPPPVVGADVFVGDVRWKILAAENLGGTLKSENQFSKDMTTTGMFVKVRFELENRGKDLVSFTGLDLIDSQDRKYTSSSDAIMLIGSDEACVLENLNPNITKSCIHVFEIPKDATGLKAYVGDLSMFGGAEAKIDLGL